MTKPKLLAKKRSRGISREPYRWVEKSGATRVQQKKTSVVGELGKEQATQQKTRRAEILKAEGTPLWVSTRVR